MIKKSMYSGPIIYAPVGALRGRLTNKPGDVILFTPMTPLHIGMVYSSTWDWDDALFWALLEITGDSDD